MDSLLATYASSDEEEEDSHHHYQEQNLSNPSSRFTGDFNQKSNSSSSSSSSIPPPKSNLPNLHPPQTLKNPSSSRHNHREQRLEDSTISNKSSSLFAALPQPKSSSLFSKLPEPKTLNSDSNTLDRNPKKVVQFRPPIKTSSYMSKNDDEDDDEEEQRKRSKKNEFLTAPTVKSFLSSIPAPKNSSSLGALPNSSGTGRRSILEADVPVSNSNSVSTVSEGIVNSNVGNYDGQSVEGSSLGSFGADGGSVEYTVGGGGGFHSNWGSSNDNYANYDSYGGSNSSNVGSASEDYANYDSYGSYGNNGSYGNFGHYENNWVDGSSGTVATEIPVAASESLMRIPGKRGRTDIPQKIIEVKQDELIKNRPREDQVKLTGIAFGPAYQVFIHSLQ
ncbi:hypothetical protein LguiB_030910 [Lonicera macranthoides]